jgi:AAHS family 4-hydroxybenzoate transporter-like MFS transporter
MTTTSGPDVGHAADARAADLAALLDAGRWTRYQAVLVLLVAVTIVFDGIDNQLLGIVIPTIMREWQVARSALAPVVSLGYLGMMAGGLIAGVAGDRFGRRTALLGSMVVFGVFTMGAALVDSPAALGVLRLLAGIGLGGAMPNAAALVADYVPVRARPLAVTVTIVCVPLGGTLAGILGIRVLPAIGWRHLFAIGGVVPLIAAVLLRLALPESPRYLVRHPARWPELRRALARLGHDTSRATTFVDSAGRGAVASASLTSLFVSSFRRDTVSLWVSFFSCLLAVYLVFSWLTSLLTSAGFGAATASTGITVFNLGGVAGALLGGAAIARVGSKRSMLWMTAAAIAGTSAMAVLSFAPGSSLVSIMALLVLTGASINGVQTTMYALAAHVYPTAVRARGVGTAVAVGRLGAVVSGFVGSWAIDDGGPRAFFLVVAAMMAVTFAALAAVERHVPAHEPDAAATAARANAAARQDDHRHT